MDVLSLKEGSGFDQDYRLGCKHSVIYRSYIHMGAFPWALLLLTDQKLARLERGFNPSVPGHFCY